MTVYRNIFERQTKTVPL